MDYLGWELERQRAALWALLGGGEAEERRAPEGKGAAWEESAALKEDTAWEGRALPGGTRRSPAGATAARRSAAGSAGRYAGGGGVQALRGAGGGFPGAWETAEEAGALWSEDLEAPAGAGETERGAALPLPERRAGERGAPAASRRGVKAQSPAREGTGPRTGLWEPTGETGPGERRTAEPRAETAAEAAGGNRAGERLAGEGAEKSAVSEAGPGGRYGGGEAFTAPRRDGSGTARLGGGKPESSPGRGERLSRVLPWSGGWESPALRAEDGARALSRAVQRDARRYDGGFTIY